MDSVDHVSPDCGPFVPGIGSDVADNPVRFGNVQDLENAFQTHGHTIAAFMVESVQGNAGTIPPPAGYFKAVRDLCTKYKVLWIADEIQCGMGRTGNMCAYQAEDVKPDIVLLGKSLGGGAYAIGMVLGQKEWMGCYKYGQHGSTYSGNPLAAAAAIASVDVVLDEKLTERARELGPVIRARLESIKSPRFHKVEGVGMLFSFFIHESDDGRVTGPRLAKLLAKRGLLTSSYGPKIRVAPPLVIQEERLMQGLNLIETCLNDLEGIPESEEIIINS